MMPPANFTEPGEHPDGSSTIVVQVSVCIDKNGMTWSSHSLDEENSARMAAWPGGGVMHLAYALLIEATRREAFICALMNLQQNPDYLASYAQGSEGFQPNLEKDLAEKVNSVLTMLVPKISLEASKEVLMMMSAQKPGTTTQKG